MSDVKINDNVKINFTPQGISVILDMLATVNAPWKTTNPLIQDIMSQLKAQEGGGDGKT